MSYLGFEIVSHILKFASINDKINARLVNKLWCEAANYQLLSIRAIYADEPLYMNDRYYMMNLLPSMEDSDHELYLRYSGNQLILKESTVMFPTLLFDLIDKFCPNVEGIVCNTHIHMRYMIAFAYRFRFIQCLSLTSWRDLMHYEKYGDFSKNWATKWSSHTVQWSRHVKRFTALESLRANCCKDDFNRLVYFNVPVKAMYSNMLVRDLSTDLPQDIKFIDLRISDTGFNLCPGKIFTSSSVIHMDISLKLGQAHFDLPNLKRINITINNPHIIKSNISEGFLQSIISSKKLEYIKLQVLNLAWDHLDMASQIVNRLTHLTDFFIVGLVKQKGNWLPHNLDTLIASITTCVNLKRMHLEFPGINEQHMVMLAKSSLRLKHLVMQDFTPNLLSAYLSNYTSDCKVIVLLESTNIEHKMSEALHSVIHTVLSNGQIRRLSSHVKCHCIDQNRCPLYDIGYRVEWQFNPFKLAIH